MCAWFIFFFLLFVTVPQDIVEEHKLNLDENDPKDIIDQYLIEGRDKVDKNCESLCITWYIDKKNYSLEKLWDLSYSGIHIPLHIINMVYFKCLWSLTGETIIYDNWNLIYRLFILIAIR